VTNDADGWNRSLRGRLIVPSKTSAIGLLILAAVVAAAAWFSFKAETTSLPDRPAETDPAPVEPTDGQVPAGPRDAHVPPPEDLSVKTIDVLIDEGEPRRALRSLERMLAASPDDADLWRLSGKANLDLSLWRQAAKDYARAIELGGETVETLDGRATALIQFRGEKEAAKLLRRSLEISPRRARPHALLARIHLKAGRRAEADEEVQKALDLDPDDRVALAVRSSLELPPR
jgi:chemotaxis protein methyltransferase CheR